METVQVGQERRPEFADLIELHAPEQDRWEANELLLLLSRFKPYDVILEIGTHRGGSARMWRDALEPRLLITVDKNEGPLSRDDDPRFSDEDFDGIEGIFGLPSQHAETRRRVKAAIGEGKVDMLFIDGSHVYADVWQDWDYYGAFARPEGIVVFHDIGTGPSTSSKGCHVNLVWNEIADANRTIEFRKNHGTGVIFL